MNYFHLLNLQEQYKIDLKQLTQNYYSLQSKYHPDKAESAEEKQKNIYTSAILNKAYCILKDDFERAKYLLELNNIKFDSLTIQNELSSGLLEEALDEQEELEKISMLSQLKELLQKKYQKQQLLKDQIALYFHEGSLEQALDILLKLKYLITLINNIKLKIQNVIA